jgi:hypothetical protein
MKEFKICEDVVCSIDLTGVSIINKREHTHLFIKYPEASIWLVLVENYDENKTINMLQAILQKSEKKTREFVDLCINNWKKSNLIQ